MTADSPARKQSRNPLKVGETFTTNEGSSCVVVRYESAKKVTVKFLDSHGAEIVTSASSLRDGRVKNPFHPSVYGVGYIGQGDHKSFGSREYVKWVDMLRRCYCSEFQEKNPAYVGCTVNTEWHNFQVFAKWIISQKNWGKSGFDLDKDVLSHGISQYGPSTCALIPAKLNRAMAHYLKSSDTAGGVYETKTKGRFAAQCVNPHGKRVHLGVFSSQNDAHAAYMKFRASNLSSVAEEFKEFVDEKVYAVIKSMSSAH